MFPGERYGFLIEANAIHSDSFKVEYLDMNTLSSKGELFLKYSVVDDLNIEDIQKSELSIYPNPSGGELNVSLKNSSQLLESIHIRSLDGRLVYLSNPTDNKAFTNISLSSGVYVVSARLNTGVIIQERVIVL